jgi:hypothetical protein
MIENRTSARENLMSAPLAAKRFTACDIMILGIHDTAFFTGDTFRMLMIKQPFQASLIVRVFLLHVGKCEFFHRGLDLLFVPVVLT